MAASGGDITSGSSRSGPHILNDTSLRSRLDIVADFPSSGAFSAAICGDAAGVKPIVDVSTPKSENRRAPGL